MLMIIVHYLKFKRYTNKKDAPINAIYATQSLSIAQLKLENGFLALPELSQAKQIFKRRNLTSAFLIHVLENLVQSNSV